MHSISTCVKNFFLSVIPMITLHLLMQLTYLTNVIVAGRYLDDPEKLAGIGLATMITNFVVVWPLLGMNGAAESLVAQAYGAGDLRICGVYLNRGRIINTVLYVPLVLLLFWV